MSLTESPQPLPWPTRVFMSELPAHSWFHLLLPSFLLTHSALPRVMCMACSINSVFFFFSNNIWEDFLSILLKITTNLCTYLLYPLTSLISPHNTYIFNMLPLLLWMAPYPSMSSLRHIAYFTYFCVHSSEHNVKGSLQYTITEWTNDWRFSESSSLKLRLVAFFFFSED